MAGRARPLRAVLWYATARRTDAPYLHDLRSYLHRVILLSCQIRCWYGFAMQQQENPTLFGITRTVIKQRYALLAPDSFVPSFLPGWEKAVCNVLISPAMGARFSQVLATLESEGQCLGNTGAN